MTTLHLSRSRALPAALLSVAAAAAVVAALALPRRPQRDEYHAFVDLRPLGGIRNGANVLSNAAFLAAGLVGLAVVRRRRSAFLDARERAPWMVLFGGVALVAVGSAVYHLEASNGTLVLDRLPMTIGFMGLLSAMIAERIDVRAGTGLLLPLVAIGVASVAWWWGTERSGAGDLGPYLLVQAFSIVSVPLLLATGAPRYDGTGGIVGGLALYGGAKVTEALDREIFRATAGLVSGHTLKHLLAAAAVFLLAVGIARRRPCAPAPAPR